MRWNDRIGRRIKLSDLHILLAVAQSGSMAKAAKDLSVSHPVVSRSISELEHTLGVRLLERSPHGVALTEYGRAMLDRSHAAFDELRQGVKDIEVLADPTAGEVRIGTTSAIAASFLSAVVDRISRRFPRVVFHVVTDVADAQQRSLNERRLDLLIFRKFGRFADGQSNFELLFESPYTVVAGSKHPLLARRRIELVQLMDEAWALPPPNDSFGSFGSFVVDVFRARGLGLPRATVFALAHELRVSLAKTGRYLTLVPDILLRFPERHPFIKKLPVELPIASAPIGIITLKNRVPSPVVQRFIDCAREVAKPLVRRK